MTLPVPNLGAPLVDIKTGLIKRPWNNWFQGFSQKQRAVIDFVPTGSPYEFVPNSIGTVYVTGGTVSLIELIRGTTTFTVTTVNGIFVSLGDTIRVTYTVAPTIKFLEMI